MAFRALQPVVILMVLGTFELGACARDNRFRKDGTIDSSHGEHAQRRSTASRRRIGRFQPLEKLSKERRECKARDDFDLLYYPPAQTAWKRYDGKCLGAGVKFEITSETSDSVAGCQDACLAKVMCVGIDFYANNAAGKRCWGWDGTSPVDLSPCSATAYKFMVGHDKAVRLALPGLPTVGDVHLVLDKIEVTKLDLELQLERVAGSTFRFTIAGVKGAPKASVDAWFEGLEFETPQSSLGDFAEGFTTFENVAANIFTFGLAGDHGRMDRGPINIAFAMAADFVYNETSVQWDVVNGTQTQNVDIVIGNGGIAMSIVNNAIAGAGGIDQIFFDAVWPLIQSIVPTQIGASLKRTGKKQKMTHKITIEGACPKKDMKRLACPTDQLQLKISEWSSVFFKPEPLLREYLISARANPELYKTKDLIERSIQAYERGDGLLSGLELSGNVDLEMKDSSKVIVSSSPRANLPFRLLGHIVPGVEIENFTDPAEETLLRGSVSADHGVWTLPELKVENLALPLALGSKILITGSLADVSIELEPDSDEPGGSASLAAIGDGSQHRSGALMAALARIASPLHSFGDDMILGHNTPLNLHSGYDVTLSRERGSFILTPMKGKQETVVLEVHPDYIIQHMGGFTKSLAEHMPLSFRDGPSDEPDGLVPKEFRKPWSTRPPLFDIAHLLNSAKVHASAKVSASKDEHDTEVLKVEAGGSVEASVTLGTPMWQFILQDKRDMGYMHTVVAGTFGELSTPWLGSKTEAGKPAILRLSCGILTIYYTDRTTKDINYKEVKKVVDLADPERQYRLHTKPIKVPAQSSANAGEVSCVQFGEDDDRHFCADHQQIESLLEAYDLQEVRLIKANTTWKEKCTHRSKGDDTCPGRPDGTWFIDKEIYDLTTYWPAKTPGWGVLSPRHQWQRAISASSLKSLFE